MSKYNKILEVKRKFEAFQNLTEKQKVSFRCPQQLTTFPVMPYHYMNAHGRMLAAFKHDDSLDPTLQAMVKSNILAIIPREQMLSKYGVNSRSPIYYKGKAWEATECQTATIDPVDALKLITGIIGSSITPTQCCAMLAVAAFQGLNASDLSKKTNIPQSAMTQHLSILTKEGLLQKDGDSFYLTEMGLVEINSWHQIKITETVIPFKAPVPISRILDWTIPTIDLQTKEEVMARNAAWIAETPEERIANNILRNVWTGSKAKEESPQIKAKSVEMPKVSRAMNPKIAWQDLTEAEYDAREASSFKTQYPDILDV